MEVIEMKLKFVICISILIIFSYVGIAAASQKKNVDIDNGKELTLNFKGSRIRVETWQGDYVNIVSTYMVKNNYSLETK